ncbi:hypothetical protein AALA78_09800 [Lachnospiraceae bacterium 42-17]|nr:hypothetical protein [Dorea sp.]
MNSINGFKYIISGENLRINHYITVFNPTIKEIGLYGENDYWQLVHLLTRKPYDIAVELVDSGIDYQSIDEYDLFYMAANKISVEQSCILLGRLELTDYTQTVNQDNGQLILYNPKDHTVIDRAIYHQILKYLRYIHFISEKVEYDVGNGMAKKFFLERMRRKKKKRLKDMEAGRIRQESQLYTMTSFLINNQNFKYNYDSMKEIKISQLYESFYRIMHNYQISNINTGIYSGTIDKTKLNTEDLDLLRSLHR